MCGFALLHVSLEEVISTDKGLVPEKLGAASLAQVGEGKMPRGECSLVSLPRPLTSGKQAWDPTSP